MTESDVCAKIYRSQTSGCGAVGSALPWGGRGRTFKSCHSDQRRASLCVFAGMAELADALDSGSSGGNFVEVQVLVPAPKNENGTQSGAIFVFRRRYWFEPCRAQFVMDFHTRYRGREEHWFCLQMTALPPRCSSASAAWPQKAIKLLLPAPQKGHGNRRALFGVNYPHI